MTQTEALNKFNLAVKEWEARLIFMFSFLTGKEAVNNLDDFVKGEFGGSGTPLLDSKGYKPRGSYFNTKIIPREIGMDSGNGAMLCIYINDIGTGEYIAGSFRNLFLSANKVKCGGEYFTFPTVAFPGLLMLNQVPNTNKLRVLFNSNLVKEFDNPIKAVSDGTPAQTELWAGGINNDSKLLPYTGTVRLIAGGIGLAQEDESPVSKAFMQYSLDLGGAVVVIDPPPPPDPITPALTTEQINQVVALLKTFK